MEQARGDGDSSPVRPRPQPIHSADGALFPSPRTQTEAKLSRLARTVTAWEAEVLAWHATDGCSDGPTEAGNLPTGKVKRVGQGLSNFANYPLRLLRHCGVSRQAHRTPARPLPTLGSTAPVHERQRSVGRSDRLPWSGRRAYRAATSVRLGWPSADGAGRGRRGGRPGYKPGWGWDPHRLLPVESTNPASALCLLPVWPGTPCGCWPTRRCCQVGTPRGGAIGPNFGGTLGRCRTVPGARPQAKTLARPGSCSWGAWPPTGYAAPALRCQVANAPDHKPARPLPALGGVKRHDCEVTAVVRGETVRGRRREPYRAGLQA
jgi:hypothetical protein